MDGGFWFSSFPNSYFCLKAYSEALYTTGVSTKQQITDGRVCINNNFKKVCGQG